MSVDTSIPRPETDPQAGRILLDIARTAIATRFGPVPPADTSPRWLHEPGAVFVTLTERGELRGCIGSLTAHRSLLDDVEHNARAAAFSDPRFPPLSHLELPSVRIEVSLLSPPEAVEAHSEEELERHVRPGVDGLILAWDGHRGTFLPQVWEQLPDPHDFVTHLKLKAGLAKTFWRDDARFERYTVTAWSDPPASAAPQERS